MKASTSRSSTSATQKNSLTLNAMYDRESLDITADIHWVVAQMSEGHPGAEMILNRLFDRGDTFLRNFCDTLNDMNVRGFQLWVIFDQCCDADDRKLINSILERDPAVVSFVNSVCEDNKMDIVAVTEGGAP